MTAMSPPGVGSVLLVLSNDRNLYPLKRGPDGGMWAPGAVPLAIGGLAQHRPAVIPRADGDNLSLIGSQDGFVRAADADTGALLWTAGPFGMIQGGPAIWLSRFSGGADDVVYAGTRNAGERNVLHAIDASDGLTIFWSFDDPGGDGIGIISGGPSIDYTNGAVYFASHERIPGAGTVWAVDLVSGAKRWSTPLGNVSSSPIQRGDILYVGADDGKVHALNVSDGSLRLNFPFDTADGVTKGFVFPNLVGRELYLSTLTTVWCLKDVEPGVVKEWSHSGIPGPSIPVYPPGYQFLWLGSSNGRLYQLDVTTGGLTMPPDTTFVDLPGGSGAVGSPSYDVPNALVYVGTEGGAVYAVQAPF
jgi:outer membrane protein assembly factor BamB